LATESLLAQLLFLIFGDKFKPSMRVSRGRLDQRTFLPSR